MRTILFISLCLFLFLPLTAAAHPHVFVDNHMAFDFDAKGIAGIEVMWVFDDMFSAGILLDYDDGDGFLSAQEIRAIKAEAFDNLKEYGFFFRIQIDGNLFPVKFITDFTAAVRGGALVYRFTVPCHVSAAATPKVIDVLVEDETNFVSIMTKKSAISVASAGVPFDLKFTYAPAPYFLQLESADAVGSVRIQFSQ
ncbi:ABC-type uncharacterized transport system, substrate-binding protein [Desulfuromusa kysingii]|uniref:ABC-type uncharacterized transport system, substrate-binding protein n=1 Tax=Desulfuromusa kysingii TaxID=37625 RepID=A0A1H3VV51_9BACT|nr:DUF1007 family protein [Desulfuromusa kysingii]SDZ77958.1 ABC-type uncharacterized transport system, substrate-binding protein [Desulfuromusa kysingii]